MTRPLTSPEPPLGDPATGIVLRPWRAEDAPALRAAWADPDIAGWTAVPANRTLAAARRWIDGAGRRQADGLALDLVIAGADDDEVRGEVGLAVPDPVRPFAEIGYWAGPAWRSAGATAAAVRLLARWATGPPLALVQVYARVHPDNPGSVGVVRRSGFDRLGVLDDGRCLWALRTEGPRRPGDTVCV